MSINELVPVPARQQYEAEQEKEELFWLMCISRATQHNRREAAHAREKAMLQSALNHSELTNARQRERYARKRTSERRWRLAINTVCHAVFLLCLLLISLNDLANSAICISAIGIMLFILGFDVARIWVEIITWAFSPKRRKSGGR